MSFSGDIKELVEKNDFSGIMDFCYGLEGRNAIQLSLLDPQFLRTSIVQSARYLEESEDWGDESAEVENSMFSAAYTLNLMGAS